MVEWKSALIGAICVKAEVLSMPIFRLNSMVLNFIFKNGVIDDSK